MSNHTTQRTINLHHSQVDAGKTRRQMRHDEWQAGYLIRMAEHSRDNIIASAFTFLTFSYMMIATAVYSGYVLS